MRLNKQIQYSLISTTFISLICSYSLFFSPKAYAHDNADHHQEIAAVQETQIQKATEAQIPEIITHQDANNSASLYINQNKVLQIKGTLAGISAKDRLSIIQGRLKNFLQTGGNPRDIKPGIENNQIVIRAGQGVLITINPQTAHLENQNIRDIAYNWTNALRKALGVDLLDRDPALVASRGFSPLIGELRNLPPAKTILHGMASWYGPHFNGRRCANGEHFNMDAFTAANKTLPFNTRVRVINRRTGKSVIVRITDRGPYVAGRIIDLSKGAAKALGMLSSGTAPVILEVLGK